MKLNKIICLIFGTFPLISTFSTENHLKNNQNIFIDLPRFTKIKSINLSTGAHKSKAIDLLQIFENNIPPNYLIIQKDEINNEDFQNEKSISNFIEFDDFTITVPIELLKSHPINDHLP